MALDRTWYNTLVDDDGSGMTGSVWDKADVDALMDATDAELARIDGAYGMTQAWTPTIYLSSGEQIGVSNNASAFWVVGKLVFIRLYCTVGVGLSASGLTVVRPSGHASPTIADGGLCRITSPGAELGFVIGATGTQYSITRASGATFVSGTNYGLYLNTFYEQQ